MVEEERSPKAINPRVEGAQTPDFRAPYVQNEQGSMGLSLDPKLFEAFPSEIAWRGLHLLKKSEFHITLLHAKGSPALSHLSNEELASFLYSFSQHNPLRLVSFLDDFRYAVEGDNKTIVIRCVVTNLDTLFTEFKKNFGVELPVQAAHVTLYCSEKDKGIHINSDQKMENLERVHLPELESALSNVRIAT